MQKNGTHLSQPRETDTLKELAEKLGLPPKAFADEMKKYAGFGRKELPEQLNQGKLYGIEVIPAIGGALGGVKINTLTQVIGTDGKPIPGFYAVGEVVGEWHGDDRYGDNAIAGNIVFGRMSAQEAAKDMGK